MPDSEPQLAPHQKGLAAKEEPQTQSSGKNFLLDIPFHRTFFGRPRFRIVFFNPNCATASDTHLCEPSAQKQKAT
jgi:hypothetical protein